MADALHEADAPPPVPGFWRLGWLLLMQPFTLQRLFVAWGLENDPSLWGLRGRLKEPIVRTLVVRMGGWLLVMMPVSAMVVAGRLDPAVLLLVWVRLAVAVVIGATFGIAFGVMRSVARGTVFGLTFGIVFSLAFSVEPVSPFLTFIAFGIVGGVHRSISKDPTKGIVRSTAGGFLFAVGVNIFLGISVDEYTVGCIVGVVMGIVLCSTFLLTLWRLPLYPVELTLTAALRLAAWLHPDFLLRLALYLPFRHHELIYFPLPFLSSFLVRLGEKYPAEGRRVLAEAAASLGQEGPARRALMELRARFLERAAREKQYASTAALELPFLSEHERLRPQGRPFAEPTLSWRRGYLATIDSIAAAAQDLEAARSTSSHHQRRQALTRGRKELERALDRALVSLTQDDRRFLPVIKSWLDRVADEDVALAALEQEQPQVPLVFVAGVPITPADENLFVGRVDLVRVLDQDLAAERPVPLVLLGQRRMGKSTLLNFLPRLLGTGTRVVRLDFQGLSGNPLRGEPHRWVTTEMTAALADEEIEAVPAPPETAPWGATLDWLSALEEPLAASDRRLLIALDEVEGLERGIREGWSDPAFLDFLRAAGDRLHRSRFLLVTAHPFSWLGSHWSDRLISAQTRRIEPLAEAEARALLSQPVPGFPDIYPPGGVERLLTETACHPYLLQLTAYHLTRRLNDAGRLKATDDDVTAALDQALEENNLFQNLWDDLSTTEQRLMAALARGEEPAAAGEAAETLSQARRRLAGEQLIQRGGDGEGWRVAVPLFARWIREIGAAR